MQSVYMKNMDDIIIRDVAPEALDPYEVRIKVQACGICGTDVTAALNGSDEYLSFGHEVAGQVIEIGKAVKNVSVGQSIVLESSSACGQCLSCRNVQPHLCTNVQSFWPKPPYGAGEEMVSPSQCVVCYESITPEEACLSEPLGVALDVFKMTDINVGSHVLVSGLGPIGLMAIRLAKLAGAETIYACDLSNAKKRLQLAEEFGADEVICVDKTPLNKYTFKKEPDRFMVTSPPKTLNSIFEVAALYSVITYIGIEYGSGGMVTFDANAFHFKRLQLRASFASPALYIPEALNLIQSGKIDAKKLISHKFEIKDAALAVSTAVNGIEDAVKVVLVSK
jgi:L-iditol 2-dehydrogenase